MFDIVLINDETWLICGGRDFADEDMFTNAMSDLMQLRGCPARVVNGGAAGADAMAREWAELMACDLQTIEADWATHGKAAGPIRNQQMLDQFRPHLVVAFPGGRGTADMISKSRAAGIDVAEIRPQTSTKTEKTMNT